MGCCHLSVILVLINGTATWIDEDGMKKAVHTATLAWMEYITSEPESMSVWVTTQTMRVGDRTIVNHSDYSWKYSGRFYHFREKIKSFEDDGKTPCYYREVVISNNSRYRFRLESNSIDVPLAITEIEPIAQEVQSVTSTAKERRSDRSFQFCSVFWLPLNGNITLVEIFKHRSFKPIKIESSAGERAEIAIEFEYIDPLFGKCLGKVWLLPKMNWLPSRYFYNVNNSWNKGVEGTNTYEVMPSGRVVCKQREIVYGIMEKDGRIERFIESQVLRNVIHNNTLAETEFTLTAFGLPEPYGIEWERPTPWGWYILGGTLGMVVLMGVIYRIRRWRAAA
jgi:hypothetical protein